MTPLDQWLYFLKHGRMGMAGGIKLVAENLLKAGIDPDMIARTTGLDIQS